MFSRMDRMKEKDSGFLGLKLYNCQNVEFQKILRSIKDAFYRFMTVQNVALLPLLCKKIQFGHM